MVWFYLGLLRFCVFGCVSCGFVVVLAWVASLVGVVGVFCLDVVELAACFVLIVLLLFDGGLFNSVGYTVIFAVVWH